MKSDGDGWEVREYFHPLITQKEIDELHKAGNHIIFISDMYLPYDFIKNLLVKNGLFNEGDRLYISCNKKNFFVHVCVNKSFRNTQAINKP